MVWKYKRRVRTDKVIKERKRKKRQGKGRANGIKEVKKKTWHVLN